MPEPHSPARDMAHDMDSDMDSSATDIKKLLQINAADVVKPRRPDIIGHIDLELLKIDLASSSPFGWGMRNFPASEEGIANLLDKASAHSGILEFATQVLNHAQTQRPLKSSETLRILVDVASVRPHDAQRTSRWHCDFNAQYGFDRQNPSVGRQMIYSVSNVLPTEYYVGGLAGRAPLSAARAYPDNDVALANQFCKDAPYNFKPDALWQPLAGQIVCFDQFMPHRGVTNNLAQPVRRSFFALIVERDYRP